MSVTEILPRRPHLAGDHKGLQFCQRDRHTRDPRRLGVAADDQRDRHACHQHRRLQNRRQGRKWPDRQVNPA